MQRITRYALLFKQILHYTPKGHSDHDKVVFAHEVSESIVDRVNEAAREKENQAKLEEIAGAIDLENLDSVRNS